MVKYSFPILYIVHTHILLLIRWIILTRNGGNVFLFCALPATHLEKSYFTCYCKTYILIMNLFFFFAFLFQIYLINKLFIITMYPQLRNSSHSPLINVLNVTHNQESIHQIPYISPGKLICIKHNTVVQHSFTWLNIRNIINILILWGNTVTL